MKVALFGNFGSSNLGNEATLQALLHNLRLYRPDVELTCICLNPSQATTTHRVNATPISGGRVRSWTPRSAPSRLIRKVCIAVISEPYSWLKAFVTLRRTEMFIVPGTGLLTDAYGVFGAGPYSVFKWVLIAKARRCRILFLSIGAGPLHSFLGRRFVALALSLADVRSYRDEATKRYLRGISLKVDGDDLVYPDLVFSLPETSPPKRQSNGGGPTVGLGIIESPGRYGAGGGVSDETHRAYLDALATFAVWLVDRGYAVRMLVGDGSDLHAKREFMDLLRARAPDAEQHFLDDPISSVDELRAQIATTDFVVASRFHNVVLSFVCGKPAICVSFHEKCDALMGVMGMDQYCLGMKSLAASDLIETFRLLEQDASRLELVTRQRTSAFRTALANQYDQAFAGLSLPSVELPEIPVGRPTARLKSAESLVRLGRVHHSGGAPVSWIGRHGPGPGPSPPPKMPRSEIERAERKPRVTR